MTKHWSRECTRYAIGLKWTTVFIQRSMRASSAIWTILASRLLSRASRASAFHGIPQMESLLAGYIQRTLSLPRSLFCLVARVTRQQRLASETSARSVQWKALNADRFLIVWNENCRIYDKWKSYLLISVKNNGIQLQFFCDKSLENANFTHLIKREDRARFTNVHPMPDIHDVGDAIAKLVWLRAV